MVVATPLRARCVRRRGRARPRHHIMSAAALLAAGLLFGLAWARSGVVATRPERLAAAAVVGVLAASWVAWLWSVLAGYRVALVAAPSSLLVMAAALRVGHRRRGAVAGGRAAGALGREGRGAHRSYLARAGEVVGAAS